MTNKKSTYKRNKLLTRVANYHDDGGINWLLKSENDPSVAQTGFKGALNSGALSGIGAAVGNLGGTLIGGELNSGAGSVISGLSSVASAIPGPWGAVASAGLGLVGGLVNKAFGSKLNEENIASVKQGIKGAQSFTANAADYDSLSSIMGNTASLSNFSNSYIGKDGWFSSKAKRKANELRRQVQLANARQDLAMVNNAENIANTTMSNLAANYSAFGGPLSYGDSAIGYDFMNRYLEAKEALANGSDDTLSALPNSFSRGGGIHINPKNKGKFTATKKRTGKTTEELTHSSNPLTRKRAIFAQNAKKWHHAFGGELNTQGADFSNGMVFINSGGSHEENPYEGVQFGIDPEGVPNLVEEGEAVFNDYVFSNRLKVPKSIRSKYKLRGSKDLTFADASKILSKESEERPNDPISQKGLIAIMADLANEQEVIKSKDEMNRFNEGGKVNKYSGKDTSTQRLRTYRNYTPLSKDTDFYSPDYLAFWDYMNNPDNLNEAQVWLNRINSKEFGDIGGNTFTLDDIQRLSRDYKKGPVHNAYKQAAESYKRSLDTPQRQTAARYWLRGEAGATPLDVTPWEGYNTEGKLFSEVYPNLSFVGKQERPYDETSNTIYTDYYYDNIESPQEQDEQVLDNNGIEARAYPTWMRYAPAVGLGISAITDAIGLTNKPDYSDADLILEATRNTSANQVRFNPIGNYLKYTPLDRDYYINKLNAEAGATRRAILQNAGLNRGAGMAALLASDNNAQIQLGNLARQAEEYNLAQRQQVEDFNRGTNITNSQGFLQADIANQKANAELQGLNLRGIIAASEMRNRAKALSDQAKSANLSGFLQSLGDIGNENEQRNWIMANLSSGSLGNFSPEYLSLYLGRARGGKIKRVKSNKKRGLTY